jgi:hypothetical protein
LSVITCEAIKNLQRVCFGVTELFHRSPISERRLIRTAHLA